MHCRLGRSNFCSQLVTTCGCTLPHTSSRSSSQHSRHCQVSCSRGRLVSSISCSAALEAWLTHNPRSNLIQSLLSVQGFSFSSDSRAVAEISLARTGVALLKVRSLAASPQSCLAPVRLVKSCAILPDATSASLSFVLSLQADGGCRLPLGREPLE